MTLSLILSETWRMERKRPLWRWLFVALPAAVLLYLAIITALTVERAIEAEYDLHALICTLRLCEEFVVRNGRWPARRADVESRVTVDFNVQLDALAALPEASQIPIRVRSTYYDLGHRYQDLYDTICRTVNSDAGDVIVE